MDERHLDSAKHEIATTLSDRFCLSRLQLIMRHPRLMAYRVKSHLEPKTKWLRERLHLGQEQLRKVRSLGRSLGEDDRGARSS